MSKELKGIEMGTRSCFSGKAQNLKPESFEQSRYSQPNIAGAGEKNFRWGQIFITFFKVWSEKLAQKCERSKNITLAVCYFCVIFQRCTSTNLYQ